MHVARTANERFLGFPHMDQFEFEIQARGSGLVVSFELLKVSAVTTDTSIILSVVVVAVPSTPYRDPQSISSCAFLKTVIIAPKQSSVHTNQGLFHTQEARSTLGTAVAARGAQAPSES